MWLGKRAPVSAAAPADPFEAPPPQESAAVPQRISIEELRALQERGEPVMILDVRTQRSLEGSDATARGGVRVDPERAAAEAERLNLPKEAWLVAFCA
jgi:hypothetical protein